MTTQPNYSEQAAFTPGPWQAKPTGPWDGWDGWSVEDAAGQVVCDAHGSQFDGTREANARLIAAAPDYHDAAFWILQAVSNNAAPINPLVALKEMALDGEHITLDAGLVLDLLKAHAKATGAAA